MRLNKYLAEAGVGSRRACDKLIEEGSVRINGNVAIIGAEVQKKDSVVVNGRAVFLPNRFTYLMLHKPKGYITSASDELGRKTIMELITTKTRVFPVGRLDYDTEGLILLTNDGELANRLMHPSNEIGKTYIAKIEGKISDEEIKQIRKGIEIDENVVTKGSSVDLIETGENFSRLKIIIYEGRNRQIRKMFEAVGKTVIFLKRTDIGEIHLGGLARGKFRYLNEKEINYLKKV